jgi:DNA-directed RNA polymerase subunit M/transcription elongation factor TFIIS
MLARTSGAPNVAQAFASCTSSAALVPATGSPPKTLTSLWNRRDRTKKRGTTDDRANYVNILFDGEIVMDGQHERFICPGCTKDGAVYRVSLRGKQVLTYVRCLDCSHEWTVERKSEIPKSRQS